MEQKSDEMQNALTISTVRVSGGEKASLTESPGSSVGKKRRRGAVHLMKVALFMIRRRSFRAKPSDVAAAAATGGNMLNLLVGSVRPLHLPSDEASPPDFCILPASVEPASPAASSSVLSDYHTDGMSSRYASVGNLQELEAAGNGGSESRYASAVNLRDLDESEEGEENGGDEMIDAKAEQFIAQFYAQIRLQRLNSMDRRYNEMIERSIA